jgi:hypothetical protein
MSKNKKNKPKAENGSSNILPAKIETVIRKENYEFQWNFTESEMDQKSKQLARACADRGALEDELKSIKSGFKAKIDSKTSEINLLSRNINDGHEWLHKTCVVQYDFDNGQKIYSYEGVRVGTEKMVAKDYQLEAQLPDYKDGNQEKAEDIKLEEVVEQ